MRLIELAQKGDQAAKQRLVEGNLKLVLSVIQRFLGRGENPDDLFQVGCIGLLKAIANFDTTKDVRFSTYGVPMIAGELRRYLRDVYKRQFQYRMKAEYGVDLRMEGLPYEQLRFITAAPVADLKDLNLSSDAELLEDYRGRSLLVFASQWSINYILKRNPGLELSETAAN